LASRSRPISFFRSLRVVYSSPKYKRGVASLPLVGHKLAGDLPVPRQPANSPLELRTPHNSRLGQFCPSVKRHPRLAWPTRTGTGQPGTSNPGILDGQIRTPLSPAPSASFCLSDLRLASAYEILGVCQIRKSYSDNPPPTLGNP
jgi:hypothetical protein